MTKPTDRWGDEIAGAPLRCLGKSELFLSEDPEDREAAVNICGTCPALAWCEQQRVETARMCGVAVGVWAGRSWTERDYRRKLTTSGNSGKQGHKSLTGR